MKDWKDILYNSMEDKIDNFKIYTMAYIYLNKETNEARIFGSITSLCNATKIKPDKLYTCFSRNKLKEYENDNFRIVKTKIERA